jgi:predicted ATPase/DNA-binding SARP family transcriptional activator
MLRISLFGRMRLAADDDPLPCAGAAETRRLLGYLLLHRGAAERRTHVAFTLWPDSTEAEAVARLRRELYVLQRALPASAPDRPWVIADRATVQWNPTGDWWLDVAEFESRCSVLPGQAHPRASVSIIPRLERAVWLYAGDLLVDDYDDWVLVERERLRHTYGQVLAYLTSLSAADGDLRGAVASAEVLVSHDDLREESHRLLMALRYLAGDRAAALGAYESCRQLLARELDVEPMPETERLADAIKESAAPEAIIELVRRDLATDVTPAVLTARKAPHNLRCHLTSFIGRERELAEVTDLVATHRLVTLTGAAGCGKTRLALEVAAGLLGGGGADAAVAPGRSAQSPPERPTFDNGVWWVDFAPLEDRSLVPQAVADVLGVSEEPGRPLFETLESEVKAKSLLLVLDNAEHVVDACAGLAERVLGAGEAVQVLATSREPLGVAGEMTWTVPPLTVPPETLADDASQVTSYEAPRLFLDRAQLCDPRFVLAADQAPIVASVSRRLDGIPLALELAAAQVRTLSVVEIDSLLRDRFGLLVGGGPAPTAHHETLRAAIDWSYQQLTGPERRLFRRLAVFRGGWTSEAAEAVCGGAGLDAGYVRFVQDSLLAKSLVAVAAADGGRRYRMLETIRQYAREGLSESGEEDAVRRRHLEHFMHLAEEASPKLRTADQAAWLDRLDGDLDNFRAALDFGASAASAGEEQLRLAAALTWFWMLRGRQREGAARLQVALPLHTAPDFTRQKALQGGAILADMLGDYAAARSMAEENLAASRATGNTTGVAASLGCLGILDVREGNVESARRNLLESVAVLRELGNDDGVAAGLHNLAVLEAGTGDLVSARQHAEESLALSRARGDASGVVASLQILGEMAVQEGEYRRARPLFEEAIEVARGLGHAYAVAILLSDLGQVARREGDLDAASRQLNEALSIHREIGDAEGESTALARLASLALDRGETGEARRLHQESLGIRKDLGDVRLIVESLRSIADVDDAAGQRHRAAVLRSCATTHAPPAATGPEAEHAGARRRTSAEAPTKAGAAGLQAPAATGQAMSLEEAVAYALGEDGTAGEGR